MVGELFVVCCFVTLWLVLILGCFAFRRFRVLVLFWNLGFGRSDCLCLGFLYFVCWFYVLRLLRYFSYVFRRRLIYRMWIWLDYFDYVGLFIFINALVTWFLVCSSGSYFACFV